ncbi:transmembrane and TPR repeat-containing protein CG4050-like isoform X3 [Varroa jacobsoni]|uniref:transmembrane and TPR repeat-containing protein CG4050-like isoform X3 n=1 Tax=Varroa jacobsoni TaxID=62625 RepID=UPI000BF4CB40|nr:transmembrane and TPR repeat-containing protein CG4050-like isoform X3 [Varroa jacobsoni]
MCQCRLQNINKRFRGVPFVEVKKTDTQTSQRKLHANPSSIQYIVVILAALTVYGNSPRCGFVFDDLSAIVSNRDVHGHTPLFQLLTNDYWGTPMNMEHSHKSYRPLSVLTFRISYALHGLQSFGYHLANVLLHAAVSASVLRFSAQWLRINDRIIGAAPFLCALLFAIHPIHTEAVTGVVGRAELLSALFFLWSLMFCEDDSWTSQSISIVMCILATLSKEQGFMAFPLCILLKVIRRIPLQKLFRSSEHKSILIYLRADSHRYVGYLVAATVLLYARYRLMNGELPVFTRWCKLGLFLLVSSHMVKTIQRNLDWKDELSIYLSGLRTNVNNAKLFNNVGFAYQQQENFEKALEFFQRASILQPDDIGSWINVGCALNKLSRFTEAEAAYSKAHSLLPRRTPRLGVTSNPTKELRIAPVHLNVFVSLANLITRNNSRLHEADMLYREAIAMKQDYVDAYTNRGEILLKMGRLDEAIQVYSHAVKLKPFDPNVHFNLGVGLVKLDNHKTQKNYTERAAQEFLTVLKLDPSHQRALLSLSMCVQNISEVRFRRRLVDRVEEIALTTSDAPGQRTLPLENVWFNLAMACVQHASQSSQPSCSLDRGEVFFRRALALRPNFRSALFNLGVLLFEQRRITDSVIVLEQLVTWHPDHVKGLMLLADIHMIHRQDKNKAKLFYHKVLEVERVDNQGVRYNLCIVESSTEAEKSRCSKYITRIKQDEVFHKSSNL